jgi:hypothetical protein
MSLAFAPLGVRHDRAAQQLAETETRLAVAQATTPTTPTTAQTSPRRKPKTSAKE